MASSPLSDCQSQELTDLNLSMTESNQAEVKSTDDLKLRKCTIQNLLMPSSNGGQLLARSLNESIDDDDS